MRLSLVIFGLSLAATAAADESAKIPENALIGRITLERQNVFDTSKSKEDNALYRLVNRLHIMTREKVISKQLLFYEGELYDKRLLEESERILRGNRYLYDASISAAAQDDGTVDVTVNTRDSWTLGPELSLSRSGGQNKTRIGVEETNLLGYGQRVKFTRSDDVDRVSQAFQFSDRQLGQSWVAIELRIADNSDGHSNLFSIAKPFHALDAKWTAGGFLLDDERRSALYVLGNEAAEYGHKRNSQSVFGGWSAGLRNQWVRRWTAGAVYDENLFSVVTNPTLPAAIPEDRKFVYPFFGIEILEDKFEKSANTDQIDRSEDFYFGTRFAATLGLASTQFGSSRDALLYTVTANAGFGSMEKKALLLSANIRGRRERGVTANATFNINARYYSRRSEKTLFFAALNATLGQNLDLDNPVEVGGDTGLRGYPLRYQSGDSRAQITIEQRYFTDWYPFQLFRVGGAIFFDAGRVFGENPVGGPNLGWLKDVGVGLRFAPTRLGTRKVLHIDIAFPLDGDPTIDSMQILFGAKQGF